MQDERDLRKRLGTLLADVEPGPPPVARVRRRGRGMRARRWISVAAGLAVLAAGAAVIPGLLQQRTAVPAAPLRYKVTVMTLGSSAPGGLVGKGTINSRRWRVVVTPSMGDGCSPQPGLLTCGLRFGFTVAPRQVILDAESAAGTQYELGTVGADVTRVDIRLSNGAVLTLRPVEAGGRRWVAFAAPLRTIRRAESYVGRSEYQYAVPYAGGGVAEFASWLRPGQAGLARASASVGSGRFHGISWHAAVQAGPWGYCVLFADGSSCVDTGSTPLIPSAGKLTQGLACGPLFAADGKASGASAGVMAVPKDVKNVVLTFAGGGRLGMTAVAIGGTKLLGYAIADHQAVDRTLEYGASGQLLRSGSSAGWTC